jgi:hypothetical protein
VPATCHSRTSARYSRNPQKVPRYTRDGSWLAWPARSPRDYPRNRRDELVSGSYANRTLRRLAISALGDHRRSVTRGGGDLLEPLQLPQPEPHDVVLRLRRMRRAPHSAAAPTMRNTMKFSMMNASFRSVAGLPGTRPGTAHRRFQSGLPVAARRSSTCPIPAA